MSVRTYRLISFVVVLVILAPIWLSPIAPLSDYVNHMARAHVLSHLGNPELGAAYASAWGPYPNLAFDLVAVPLTGYLDAAIVGKLFLTITVFAWAWACEALGQAALGRPSWRAIFATFFVTCEPFLFGYANFTFGMAMAMFAVAGLLRARDRSDGKSLVGPAIFGVLAAVSHAAAIVTLGLCAAGFAAARLLEKSDIKRALRDLAPVVPGAAFFGYWLVAYADRSKDRAWASPGASVKILATSILPSYEPKADLAILAALALAAAVAIATARPLLLKKPVAVAALLCVVAVFIAPSDFGGSYDANGRYALGAWTLGLFAIQRDELAAAGKRRPLPVFLPAGFALVVLFGRQLLVDRAWLALSHDLQEQIVLLDKLPKGARLANATWLDAKAPRSARLRELALLHAPAMAAVTRDAVVPTLYAIKGVQPLAHKQALYDVHRFKAGDETSVDVDRIRSEMDAVWMCRAPESVAEKLRTGAESLGKAGDCELILLRRR